MIFCLAKLSFYTGANDIFSRNDGENVGIGIGTFGGDIRERWGGVPVRLGCTPLATGEKRLRTPLSTG